MDRKEKIYLDALKFAQDHGYPKKSLRSISKNITEYSYTTLWRYVMAAEAILSASKSEDFKIPEIPDKDLNIEDIVSYRKKQFEQYSKHEEAKKFINVPVLIDGPIAVSHWGDPHVDDDGTDLSLIEEHARIINSTLGMYAGNIGDSTNNWVGRLVRLYGLQGTTVNQAQKLLEWFINLVDWLYVLYGNHDTWNDGEAILNFLLKGKNTIKVGGKARINLQFPNGREVRINARHKFPGHSMYNPAHGMAKAAKMGWRDHILVGGHTHQSGHTIQIDPSNGFLSHCIRVASYKIYDRFAEDMEFDNQAISANFVTVINPYATKDINLVQVYYDVEEGAERLKEIRKRLGFDIKRKK